VATIVRIRDVVIGEGYPLVIIAGPCVVEDREMLLNVAGVLSTIQHKLDVPVIFKSSYKKANRTSDSSFMGIGMDEALNMLDTVRNEFGFPLITDVHSESECARAAEVVDILQIPAFLCRQTELLRAAGQTGKPVNIKKGQFMAPEKMKYQAEKVIKAGSPGVVLTERGTTFGYEDLVVDMRAIPIMKSTGYPVIFDATHSVQIPGSSTHFTGGRPEFIAPLARAAVAAGCDAVFIETHPDPPHAKSDAGSQLNLAKLYEVVREVLRVREALSV
jgi:2-dehydro-3-deoxyphosphooctonate aldolase (KDO 8-P synthase)